MVNGKVEKKKNGCLVEEKIVEKRKVREKIWSEAHMCFFLFKLERQKKDKKIWLYKITHLSLAFKQNNIFKFTKL